jgi:hypothetical protein
MGPVEGGLRLRILDETTALAASRDPQAFGASSGGVSADGSRVRLALLPYATAFFEAERGPRPT